MTQSITKIHQVIEGIEIIYEEERGISKRTYTQSLVIDKKDFKKIKEMMDKNE